MAVQRNAFSFGSTLSLAPLIEFWRQRLAAQCNHMTAMFESIHQRILKAPYLQGPIEDPTILTEHYDDILKPLMSVIFPPATWEREIAGALKPFENVPFFGTPQFNRLMVDGDGRLNGAPVADTDDNRLLKCYFMILDKVYGIRQKLNKPFVWAIQDQASALQRYFRILPDVSFVQVRTVGDPPELSTEQRSRLVENISDLRVLSDILPAHHFEFHGFTVFRSLEVTESEVISQLERDLIDQQSIFSGEGFERLQQRLRTLFGRADLAAEIAAVKGDQVLVINSLRYKKYSDCNCIFRNSNHIPMEELKGSVWLEAVEKGEPLRVDDLNQKSSPTPAEKSVVEAGYHSMIVAPLYYQGQILGTFEIMSPRPGDLTSMDLMLVKQVAPLFSVALKRGLDEMNNEIQSIIKEKCTAVHPSVEWRFRQAAYRHMERRRLGELSEMEPIIFQNVVPLFGQADVRGSAVARNRSIQADLTSQLTLAREVMHWADKAKSWPLLNEYRYRIERRMARISQGISSNDETAITQFLRQEVEPTFEALMGLGPRVVYAIEQYRQALDPDLGVVCKERKAFEQSVARLIDPLSAYLDAEQEKAQHILPHYFEKHQTDGLDYMIYLGASMREDGELNPFFIKNLGLWQLMVAFH